MPIGVDAKPTETGYAEVNKEVEEIGDFNVGKVEEGEDSKAEPFDDKEGRDPDNGGEDEVVVGRAEADDEEGADGDGGGGKEDGDHEEDD